MRTTKIFSILISWVIVSSGIAQQMPQYSQYLRNQFMINPGAAGVYDFTDVTLSGRMQWAGFTNAPMTSYFSISTPLSSKIRESYNPSLHISSGPIKKPEVKTGKLKHAGGLQMIADQYGPFRQTQFSATYAIHVPISRKINISLGTKLGFSNHVFLPERAIVMNAPTDNTYTNYTSNQGGKTRMDLGMGMYLYSGKMFCGLSVDQLTKNFVEFGSGTANYDPRMHMSLTGGYTFSFSDDFEVTPAILIKYMRPVNPVVESTVQIEYKHYFWAGVSYRHKDAIIGMVGMNISRRFKFGYSYDFSLSKFSTYSSGGHEFILGIMLR